MNENTQYARILKSNHPDVHAGDVGEVQDVFECGYGIAFKKKWSPTGPSGPIPDTVRVVYFAKEFVELQTTPSEVDVPSPT